MHAKLQSPIAETLASGVRRRLAEEILAGTLPPGARLEEEQLARRLSVSRTPLREALRDLASSGLVELRPHRGAIVVPLDPQRLVDLMEAVGEVDALCAKLAAGRMTDIERQHLRSLQRDGERALKARNRDAYAAYNRQLHDCIALGAHNRTIAETALNLRIRSSPFRRAQLEAEPRMRASHAEHQEVVSAIIDGDAASAYRAMREHIAAAGRASLDRLARHAVAA